MNNFLLYGIGFGAQLLFAARIMIQWMASERSGQVKTPLSFWFLSLGGASLMIVYGLLRQDIVITIGQTVLFCIYCRNVTLMGFWTSTPFLMQILLSLPLVILLWPPVISQLLRTTLSPSEGMAAGLLWLGSCGQAAMFARFLLQWCHAERLQRSRLPRVFWCISLIGAILLLIYAVLRHDPVLIIGQIFGIVVYIRNLILLRRHQDIPAPIH